MKITKYGHACFTVEENGETLVIDPGGFSQDFIPNSTITAIVITHEHGDHFDPDTLAAIYAKNPHSTLISTKEIVATMPDHQSIAVKPADTLQLGAFELEFFGGTHAEIHKSMPAIANLGVLINHTLYYPGDALTLPNLPIKTLALPVAAPWVKISEVIDFLIAAKPNFAFPTHDAILSKEGQQIVDRVVGAIAEEHAISYKRLSISMEV